MFKLTILLIVLITPSVKALTDNQKALLETAKAYYYRQENIQYCSFRRNDSFSPEDAVEGAEQYTVCSGFTYNSYRESLGLIIPPSTAKLTAAAYYNQTEPDIIKQWTKTELDSIFDSNNVDGSITTFIQTLYSNYGLQEGDLIILLRETSGHVIMANDPITEGGVTIDTNILHSTSNYEKVSNKITKGLSYNDSGTIQKTTLLTQLRGFYNSGEYAYLTLYRPLINNNGTYNEYECSLKSSNLDSYNPNNYNCTKEVSTYEITPSSRTRMQYPGLQIDKKVASGSEENIINNSEVSPGTRLYYTITITNNSESQTYDSIRIVEKISPYVDAELTNEEERTIEITLENIAPNTSASYIYSANILAELDNLGKTIESNTTIGNIKAATIRNKISEPLTDVEAISLKNAYQSLKNSTTLSGVNFIKKVYEEANLDLDFTLDNFDITNLVQAENGTASNKVRINSQNSFSKYVLSNYYGAIYNSSSGITYLKYWESTTYGNSDRASKIYKEHLKPGDILIYKNENDSITKENGTYAFIYLDGSFYGINKLSDGTPKNEFDVNAFISSGSTHNTKSPLLTTLLAKDYYVILRPSQEKILPKESQNGEKQGTDPEVVTVADTMKTKDAFQIILGAFFIMAGLGFILNTKKLKESK